MHRALFVGVAFAVGLFFGVSINRAGALPVPGVVAAAAPFPCDAEHVRRAYFEDATLGVHGTRLRICAGLSDGGVEDILLWQAP